ncbi:MAG: Ldh family oxidoreductase, partial [Pseudomonadota bacterium]
MPVFGHGTLHDLISASCVAGGSTPREAELVADNLVEANLTGHDSHGVGLLPVYVRSLHNGSLRVNRHAQLVLDRGPILVIEGDR